MKFLKKLFIVLLIVTIVIAIAFFVAVKTIDINQIAKKITNDLSTSLDINISVKDVTAEFSLTKGMILRLTGIAAQDNVSEGRVVSPFFTAKALLVDVNIKELIKEKKMIVEQVIMQSAELMMITDKEGNSNIPFEKFTRISAGAAAGGCGGAGIIKRRRRWSGCCPGRNIPGHKRRQAFNAF